MCCRVLMIPFCQRVLDRVPGKASNVSNWHFLTYYSFETHDLLYYFLRSYICHLAMTSQPRGWITVGPSHLLAVLSDVKNYGAGRNKDIAKSKGKGFL
ncbi:uncharacterized protein CEXT_247991 [Caerostris extrusa]|uniref:Uncharacterized protein n=1 Tax=Caerostris extrusa TaxID=172846 RepID=A0AAV4VNM4_CAEEX|nr:uncharacterized protein CEXT_247991 [Caerostris extrusa]